MRLLFDQNLSAKLCLILKDLFPDSSQTKLLDLQTASDTDIWSYAAEHGYAVVTKDSDFAEMAALKGPPPKVIWLRCGNKPTLVIAERIRTNQQFLADFEHDETSCSEIY